MSLALDPDKKRQLEQLRVQVLAAELHLTHFAQRAGKESDEYQNSLRDFGAAWYLLKKHRNRGEFIKDVVAS